MRTEIHLTDELTAEQYSAADAIVIWMETHPGFHNVSTISRGIKTDYDITRAALRWLDRNRMIAATGNKSWRNYGSR